MLGCMRITTLLLVVATIAGLNGTRRALAAQDSELPRAGSGNTLAARFFDASDQPLAQFRAVRHMEATNVRFNKHGWVDAVTELSPNAGFTYRVLAEGGSSYIRRKVLLPLLEAERTLVAQGDASARALSKQNYVITSETPAGGGLVRLAIRPLREETTLVEGHVYVTDTDADLVRIEGRLIKNPSFWTRRVDVVRHYGRIAGVRVPLQMESVAQLRIAGRSELTMTYRYEAVNGRLIESGDGQ